MHGLLGQGKEFEFYCKRFSVYIKGISLDALWGLECHGGGARRVRKLLQLSRWERIVASTKKMLVKMEKKWWIWHNFGSSTQGTWCYGDWGKERNLRWYLHIWFEHMGWDDTLYRTREQEVWYMWWWEIYLHILRVWYSYYISKCSEAVT